MGKLLLIFFVVFGLTCSAQLPVVPMALQSGSSGLPSAVLWLDASTKVTNSAGVSPPSSTLNVGGWGDLSGSGNHLIQGATTRCPGWNSTGGPTNGPRVIWSQSNAQGLTNRCGVSTFAQPNTVFAVFRDTQSPVSGWTGCFFNSYASQNTQVNTSSGGVVQLYNGTGVSFTTTAAAATYMVWTFVFNNTSSVIRTNGVVAKGGTSGTGDFQGITLGNFFNFTQSPTIDLAYFKWFNGTAFTTNQIHAEEQLVGAAYGITVP